MSRSERFNRQPSKVSSFWDLWGRKGHWLAWERKWLWRWQFRWLCARSQWSHFIGCLMRVTKDVCREKLTGLKEETKFVFKERHWRLLIMVSAVCLKTTDTMLCMHYCCLYISKTLEFKASDHVVVTWQKEILISAIENEKSRVRNEQLQTVRTVWCFEIHSTGLDR